MRISLDCDLVGRRLKICKAYGTVHLGASASMYMQQCISRKLQCWFQMKFRQFIS